MVYNCGGKPEASIPDPARLDWEAVLAVEHYRIWAEQIPHARE